MTATTYSDLEIIEKAMVEWHEYQSSPEFDVTSFINKQLNIFLNSNHDPFDERHPSKIDSASEYGKILRSLGTQPGFFETIICYLESNNPNNPKGASVLRFFCGVHMGISIPYTATEDDSTSKTLYDIAMSNYEPVNYYATMLIGIIMGSEECIYANRSNNDRLIPVVLRRMHALNQELQILAQQNQSQDNAKNIISSFPLEPPLNIFVKIRMCIWYLLPLAEYVDLMPLMNEQNITSLIYSFISKEAYQLDICLTFDALRLLSSLLCHRFVHLSFVEDGGLEKVLEVPYPSVAATAVSVVLYFTAYFEDAMERVCLMPTETITKIIKYALWLIECSHPSAKCYSIYFLHIAFQYGNCFRILKNFNAIAYLYNAMTVLPLRLTEEINTSKDTTSWHIIRASLNAIKRFCEISLFHWMDSIDHSISSLLDQPPKMILKLGHRPITYTNDQFFRVLIHLVNRVRPTMHWKTAGQLSDMGAILLFYRIIASNYYSAGNWPWRNEVARLAVEILNLMAIMYPLADQIATFEIPQFSQDYNDLWSDSDHHHHHHHGHGRHGHGGRRNGGGNLPFMLIETLVNDLVRSNNSNNNPDLDVVIDPDDETPRGDNLRRDNNNHGPLNHSRNLYLLSDPEDETSQDAVQLLAPTHNRNRRPAFLSELNSNENSNSSSLLVNGNLSPSSGPPQQPQNNNNPNPSSASDNSNNPSSAAAAGPGNQLAVNSNGSNNNNMVNCLLLLMSFSCDDEVFDSSVVKAVLMLLNTLAYKPIDENENIDNPVLANTVTSQEMNAISRKERPLNERNVNSSPTLMSTRKRRFDDSLLTTSQTTQQSGEIDLMDQTPGPTNLRTMGNMMSETSMPSPFARQKTTHLLYRQSKLWHIIRKQHGIMTLIYHIKAKRPIKDADSIRTLACRALLGLARYDEARSILAKLPLFSKSIIAQLMKEPVLLDRLAQHSEFCRYANSLIRLVVGNIPSDLTDAPGSISDLSLEKVRKAAIVATTKINWDSDELLEIIHRHLEAKGLHGTADSLLREANIRPNSLSHVHHHHMSRYPLYDSDNMTPPKISEYHQYHQYQYHHHGLTPGSTITDSLAMVKKDDVGNTSFITPSSIRYNKPMIMSNTSGISGTPKASQLTPRAPQSSQIPGQTQPPTSNIPNPSNWQSVNKTSEDILTTIVTSYLRQQHSLCPHPMSTCPKFSLYHPHRCPNPTLPIPENTVIRHWHRQHLHASSKMRLSYKQERKFLHSRFYPDIIVRDADDDILNCCFSVSDDGLFVGSQSGSIGWVDLDSESVPHELVSLHSKSIRHMEQSKDASRLLVVSEWGEPSVCIVKLAPKSHVGMPSMVGATADARSHWEATFEPSEQIPNIAFSHAEFSNTGNQTRIIATEGSTARIYDLNTTQQLSRLQSVDKQSGYKVNKACFSYDDNLVLNDGVVWDVRVCNATRPIHKLDKFQDLVSGRFHPNQLEIIIGSAVWDMRMWRLVKTVSAMDRQIVRFSPNNDVIYSGLFFQDEVYLDHDVAKNPMKSMFRTLDAADYSLIATVDVKHQIEHMALDTSGHYIALVEYVGLHDNNKTQCRIYTVGRKKTGRGNGDGDDEDEVNLSGEDDSENDSDESTTSYSVDVDDDDDDEDDESLDEDETGSRLFWTDSYSDVDDDDEDHYHRHRHHNRRSRRGSLRDMIEDDDDDEDTSHASNDDDENLADSNENNNSNADNNTSDLVYPRSSRGVDQDSNDSWVTINSDSSGTTSANPPTNTEP